MPDGAAPRRHSALPPTLAPRGLSRVEAAAYIGLSTGKFDELVADGSMPRPKTVGARKLWDRHALDRAFDDLPDDSSTGYWDKALNATPS